ncbi:MAG: hypothetical protein HYY06_20370 [Deltaproteobacteria bacterium]|nr:hypothetical protein [Deltaproteobacteria bacterium]
MLRFEPYQARRIVNVHRHVDGPWFWDKYTAHPYVGCRSGCSFCFLRGGRYSGTREPSDLDQVIRVKENAPALLRRELGRLEREVLVCGDWQEPAESRYRLSRAMLEVVRDLGFPLLVIERSPSVVRDVDLLVEIGRRSWAGVLFSISNLDRSLKAAFEPRSPGVRGRLEAMARLAGAGVHVGTALTPIIPAVGDDLRHLDDVVRATRDHGGAFVLAGGMTLDGAQRELTLGAARRFDPALPSRWTELYGDASPHQGGASPSSGYQSRIGLLVRELCARHELCDRIPRPILPGPRAANKRVAERLFLRTYDLELDRAPSHRVWAHRKAAWAIDELPENVADIHRARGVRGLAEVPAVGGTIAREIATWLERDPDLAARSADSVGSETGGSRTGEQLELRLR